MLPVTLMPRETIYSLLSRAHIGTGNESPLDTLTKITGKRGYKPQSGVPTHLENICRELRLQESALEIIENHTLYKLFLPFFPAKRRAYLVEAMLNDGSAKARLGLLKSHCGANDQLGWCERCQKEDIERYGFCYWHLEHTAPGVHLCPLHATPLHIVDLSKGKYAGRFLMLPADKKPIQFNPRVNECLLRISLDAFSMLTNSIPYNVDRQIYQELLLERGLAKSKKYLNMGILVSMVRDWLSPLDTISPFNRLYRALDIDRNWVASVVAGKDGFHHPLKHLVIWNALGICEKEIRETSRKNMYQLELPLSFEERKVITKEEAVIALEQYKTVSKTADYLGCTTTTLATLLDTWNINRVRKTKRIFGNEREKIQCLVSQGLSSKKIADETGISISSINRIKRSFRNHRL